MSIIRIFFLALAVLASALFVSRTSLAGEEFVLQNQQSSHYLTDDQGVLGETDDGNQNGAAWQMEMAGYDDAAGLNLVRLKSSASGGYLNIQNGGLQSGPIQLDWVSALWMIQPVGQSFRIQNAQDKSLFLSASGGTIQALAADPSDMAALWQPHALPVAANHEQGGDAAQASPEATPPAADGNGEETAQQPSNAQDNGDNGQDEVATDGSDAQLPAPTQDADAGAGNGGQDDASQLPEPQQDSDSGANSSGQDDAAQLPEAEQDSGQDAAEGQVLPAPDADEATLPEPTPDDAGANADAGTEPPAADGQQDNTDTALLPEPQPDADSTAEDGQLPEPVTDGESTNGDTALLPEPVQENADGGSDGTTLPEPIQDDAAAATGEADATQDNAELLPPPAQDDAAVGTDAQLPAPNADQQSGEQVASAPQGEDGTVVETSPLAPSDVQPTDPPQVPEGQVLVVVENNSSAPMDVFVEPEGGGTPVYVMTLNEGYAAMQPSPVGRKWRVAQNDTWQGGFVPTSEPTQRFTFPQAQ